MKFITKWINSYTLEFTACNSCCISGNVFLEIQEVHCHSGQHSLLHNVYRTSLPRTPLCCQDHSHVSCGCTQYNAKCSLQLAGNSTHQCFREFKTECKGHVSLIWPVTSNINIITVAVNAIHFQRHSDLALNPLADHTPQPKISVMTEYISACILIYMSLWHQRKWKIIM
jgi:hypothetical protein